MTIQKHDNMPDNMKHASLVFVKIILSFMPYWIFLLSVMIILIESKQFTNLMMMDLKKPFDTVNH